MSLSLENAIVEVQNLCFSAHTVQELTEIEQKAKDIYDQHQSSVPCWFYSGVDLSNKIYLFSSKIELGTRGFFRA